MKRLLLLVTLTSLLGCSPLFIAGALVGGTIVYDQRSLSTLHDDHAINYHIDNEMYLQKERFKKSHITVITFNHVVLLVGQTPAENLRNEFEQIALSSPKVRRVYNQITVGKPTTRTRRSKDAIITTMVKSRMLGEQELKSGQIKVVTENAVVYLMGDVSARQADLATRISRQITGVRKVVRLFETESTDKTM